MFKTQTSLWISSQSRSRELRTTTALRAPPKELERLRGQKGFLTWAFVLAQVAAAELLVGGGAKATQDDDTATRLQPQADLNAGQPGSNSAARVGAAHEAEFAEDDPTSSIAIPQSHVASPEMLARSLAPTLGHPSRGGGEAGGGGGGGSGGGGESSEGSFSFTAIDDLGDAGIGPIGGGGGVLGGVGPVEIGIGPIGGGGDVPSGVGPVEIGIGPITVGLNPVHVNLTPLEFSVGAEVNLGSILGFDVRLESEGLILSPELDLNTLSIDELVSDVTEIVGAQAIDLGNLTNVDIPGLGAFSGSTLGELTGLQLPGIAPLPHGLLEHVNAMSSNDPPIPATLVPGVAHLHPLGVTGNTVSGETIVFPEQPLNPIATFDQLFAGNQHTDYGMVLNGIESAVAPAGTLAGGAPSPLPAAQAADTGNVPLADHDVGASPTMLSSSLDDLSLRSLPA